MIKRSSKPEYSVKLPILGKTVKFSPFNMRSERSLMLATQTEDQDELTNAVINTINDHISTSGVKAEDLSQAEAELLLLNMRAKSVGEKIDVTVEDPENEGKKYDAKVDLTKITVNTPEGFSDTIQIDEETVIKFRLPGLSTMEGVKLESEDEFSSTLAVIARCIAALNVGEESYMPADTPIKDFEDFLLELDTGEFQKISDQFFTKLPSLSTTITIKRPDKTSFKVEVAGLASFL
jgi:hypothetical protein